MKKILIIEDEEVLRRVLVDRFKNNNWDVSSAQDGEEGIELLKKENFDIIILDLVMPKVDGFGVLEAIKGIPAYSETPIIVLSNLGADSDIKRAINLGATDYFVKTQHPVGEIVKKADALATEGHSPKGVKAYSSKEEVESSKK